MTPTSKTLIDLLLTNKPELFSTAGVLDLGLSEHCMIFGLLNGVVNQHPSKVIEFRSMKNLDQEELKKDMEQTAWLLDNSDVSVDEQYTHWLSEFNSILDKHMPKRRMKVRKRDAPYMTAEWKAAIRKKRKYAKKFKRDNSIENLELMKKWRNNATRIRRQAIKKYWNEKSISLKSNPKKFYKTFMPFLNSKTSKDKSDIALKINNKIEQDQGLVAEEFTKYFANISDHIRGSQVHTLTENNCDNHTSIQLIRKDCSRDLVLSALSQLKLRRSLGI